jgi:signal peptidase I
VLGVWLFGARVPPHAGVCAGEGCGVSHVRILLVTMIVGLALAYLVIFHTFRMPSDSMMPTLLDGDFILVNQASYGLRLPFTRLRLLRIGTPQHGDVVVFRYPRDASVFYLKRVVGLPGDRVEVRADRFVINGTAVPFSIAGTYDDGCYTGMQRGSEQLGPHHHEVLVCPVPIQITARAPPTCNRRGMRGYLCSPDSGAAPNWSEGIDVVVPPGTYFVVGDNRDNSEDSRSWGFVPEENLIGKPVMIWLSWDLARTGGPLWSRSWKRIE